MQQIECVEDNALGTQSHRCPKRLEVRNTIAVLDNCLAIEDRRLAPEVSDGANDGRITGSRPAWLALSFGRPHQAGLALPTGADAPVFEFHPLLEGRQPSPGPLASAEVLGAL